MKRSTLKRKTPLARGKPIPRKHRLKPMSDKRRRELVIYLGLIKEQLTEFPFCQVCGPLFFPAYIKPHRANQNHHSMGRGKYYLDKSTYRSACDKGHHHIHFVDPKRAREVGLLPPR